MIKKMREMAPTIMLIVIIAFVGGTIFMDWGMNAAGRASNASLAGKVNGKDIPFTYFDQQVNLERQRLQDGGQEVSPYQYRLIPSQVWEKEVSSILINEVFKKMQLGASADEVFEHIKRNPLPGIDTVSMFLSDGVFDTTKYVEFLNNPENYRNYPFLRDIEQYTHNVIVPVQKLEAMINSGTTPSKAEVEYQYFQEKQKVVFEYVQVNKSKFIVDSNEITESMINSYYSTHKDSFIEPEMVDLYYLKFSKEPTSFDEQFYYNEMMDIKQKIETSKDSISVAFAYEASIESDDPGSAENGGDLGWFGKGTMVPEFDSVTFQNEIGTISDPIKTQYGYHLIFVEGKETKDGVEKVKARHILRNITATIETLDRLEELADSMRMNIIENGIVEASNSTGTFTFDSTGFFKRGDIIPNVGIVSGAGQFAFGREDAEASQRCVNDEAYYIFTIKRRHKKGLVPLETVHENIVTNIIDSLQQERARAFTVTLKGKLTEGMSLISLKDTDSTVEVAVTDTVAVEGYIPGIGYQTKVSAVAAALGTGKTSEAFEFEDNFYIVKTVWKNSVAPIDWASSDVKTIIERTKQMNQQNTFNNWSAELKNQAKIENNIDQYYFD